MLDRNLVKWLIDDTYDSDIADLLVALKSRNITHKIFTIKDYYECFMPDPDWSRIPYEKEDKVFFQGSIRMTQKIQRYTPWIPGTIGDFQFVDCVNYYPILHTYLLNRDYAFTNIKNLRQNWEFYKKCFGEYIFVRPTAGNKIFTGGVFDDVEELFNSNQTYLNKELLNTELAVLSKAQDIDAEYRFLVVNGEVITGSSYRVNGDLVSKTADHTYYSYVREVAQILKDYEVGSIVDIAVVSGKPHVLELNTVSCSGLYKMDMNLYIDGVHEACRILIEKEEV